MPARINIDAPLWDQSSFIGRFKHFLWVTDPRTVIVPDKKLYEAKALVEHYRKGTEPAGTTLQEVIYAKKLVESAFHPDSGEKQGVLGRMSCQLPQNMILAGAMLQWRQSNAAIIFWQWTNQSINAFVNYTNRNANSPITRIQLLLAYVTATTSALVTALGCKHYWAKKASPLLERYVPFAAVAAANCVNIPMMRQNELINGIECADENGKIIGNSRIAAAKGISQVVFSRIIQSVPTMLLLPIAMERLECYPWFKKRSYLHGPLQMLAAGVFLIFMVPLSCALFPQKCRIKTSTIKLFESENYEKIKKKTGADVPQFVYFNKGL